MLPTPHHTYLLCHLRFHRLQDSRLNTIALIPSMPLSRLHSEGSNMPNRSGSVLGGAFIGFVIIVALRFAFPGMEILFGDLIGGFIAGPVAGGARMVRGAIAGILAGIFGGIVVSNSCSDSRRLHRRNPGRNLQRLFRRSTGTNRGNNRSSNSGLRRRNSIIHRRTNWRGNKKPGLNQRACYIGCCEVT
jgi:hypothetical protein